MDIDKLQRYRLVYHILFWITFILVFSLFFTIQYSFAKSVMIIALTAASYMPAVYFNVLYLIPNILVKKRRFNQYIFLVLLTVLASVPLVAVVSYYNFSNIENFSENYSIWWLMIGSFINTFFMVVLVSGLKFAKDYFIQQQRNNELQQQNLVSELKFLKSQINPHFLFNTLNNIYSLTLKKDELAPEAVLKLSELMRYILYECNERQVPLTKEIQCINNYIDLEWLRHGDENKIELNVVGKPEDYSIAPLLFIPFLENSFKHGLNNQIAHSWVKIDLQIKDEYLRMAITNSKSAVAASSNKSGGIGLNNVRRRLDLLYPNTHHLEITEDEETYAVNLTIKLRHNFIQDLEEEKTLPEKANSWIAVKIN